MFCIYQINIKINNNFFIYLFKNNYFILRYKNIIKCIKLFFKIILNKNVIKIFSKNKKKLLLYKSLFKEINKLNFKSFKKKINLVGLGYKINLVSNFLNNKILQLKIGFSHLIYLKLSFLIIINLIKFNNLFLESMNFKKINEFISFLKNLKSIDIYKGKGIMLQGKKFLTKKIKKI